MADTVPTIPSDAGVLDALRATFLRHEDEMRSALGPTPDLLPSIDGAVYLRRVANARTDAAALAQFFLLGKPVSSSRLEDALRPMTPRMLVDSGLAVRELDLVRPLVRISSQSGVLIASDILNGPQAHDFVAGPSPSARRAERLTIRAPMTRALDLGTGSGIQALLAARHCVNVVAVDVNERALGFARFNARLNGVSNIDFRKGDWLEPVAGERFDLIAANPPYVISPDTTVLYRDSGLSGDAITLKLLREVPSYLEDGGFAHVIGNWVHRRDDDWRDPLETCIEGSGCDALFLKYATFDLVSYAAHWNASVVPEGMTAYLDTVDRWLAYYQRQSIEAISEGCIVLRRRAAARNWRRAIEVPGKPTGAAGDHVLRLVRARDRRDVLADDEVVLSMRFTPAPGLRVVSRAEGERFAQRSLNIEVESGVGFSVKIRPDFVDLLFALDGGRPLRELCRGTAEDLAEVRRLFALGLIVMT